MAKLQLIGDDDDLYSGFNDYSAALDTTNLEYDDIFQQAVRSSYATAKRQIFTPRLGTSNRLGTAARIGAPTRMGSSRLGTTTRTPTASRFGTASAMRLGTSSGYRGGTPLAYRPGTSSQSDDVLRPMTAVRGAGYTSQRPGSTFDPLNQAAKGPAPQLEVKKEDTPEEKIKQLEQRITKLIEESCLAQGQGEQKQALDRAKEASVKERSLIRLQEQAGLRDSHNLDLTFAVLFNLANQYANSEMYQESLNTYHVITKNRMFNNANRLKVNMGNIHFKLGDYPKAVKMYRMALDQVPNTHKELRLKIMHNIGILFVRMGQYNDAVASFEFVMQEKPDFATGLHMIVCHYALGDKDSMKRCFQMLLEVPLNIDDDEKYTSTNNDDTDMHMLLEVIRNDDLRKHERKVKQEAEGSILMSAKLISPVIEDTFKAGYDWCMETMKASNYSSLAGELEINKAVMFLKQKQYVQAIDALKEFERKDNKLASAATTNLAFIYYLQGDTDRAEKYAEQARASDGYNAAALVNLGCCSLSRGDAEKARELFTFALDSDASCVEALYDLGLANKQLGLYDDAIPCFMKLQAIFRHQPQVLFQLAHLHELADDIDQATEWYHQVIGLVPSDPGILRRLGQMFERSGDKQQAFQYHYDSYRHYPAQLDVLNWLGSYYVDLRVAEKAVVFFHRAALCQPGEVKWRLMVASCHRRTGDYHRAMDCYKEIHRDFPDNVECLRFLVRICSDLRLKEANDFAMELKKMEKAKEVRERISSSRPGTRGSLRSSSGRSSRGGSGISEGSAGHARSSLSAGNKFLPQDSTESYPAYGSSRKDLDASYSDPLGPMAERPRTSAGRKPQDVDEFGDEDFGDDLLPEFPVISKANKNKSNFNHFTCEESSSKT